jgi:hypothetical protein
MSGAKPDRSLPQLCWGNAHAVGEGGVSVLAELPPRPFRPLPHPGFRRDRGEIWAKLRPCSPGKSRWRRWGRSIVRSWEMDLRGRRGGEECSAPAPGLLQLRKGGISGFWPGASDRNAAVLASGLLLQCHGRRRSRVLPPVRLLGCSASLRAGIVMSQGLASGSRKNWLLGPAPAGAAHDHGSEDKHASPILSVPRSSPRI